jgi:hypothetical protein
MDTKQVKRIADREVKAHEKRLHGAKKMAKGGVTSESMMKVGRNMARSQNQGGK